MRYKKNLVLNPWTGILNSTWIIDDLLKESQTVFVIRYSHIFWVIESYELIIELVNFHYIKNSRKIYEEFTKEIRIQLANKEIYGGAFHLGPAGKGYDFPGFALSFHFYSLSSLSLWNA